MTFRDILSEIIDWLQQDQPISHRALQRQFDLDDASLQNIKGAILYAHPVTDDGQGLVWAAPPAMLETETKTCG